MKWNLWHGFSVSMYVDSFSNIKAVAFGWTYTSLLQINNSIEKVISPQVGSIPELGAIYMEGGRFSKEEQFFVGLTCWVGPCGSQVEKVEKDREGIQNGGWQKQKCNLAGAPNDGFLLDTLKSFFRLSRVLYDL